MTCFLYQNEFTWPKSQFKNYFFMISESRKFFGHKNFTGLNTFQYPKICKYFLFKLYFNKINKSFFFCEISFTNEKRRSQFSIIQRTSDKRFEIWDNLQQCSRTFFRNLYSNLIYLASKLVKKRKIWWGNFITYVGFVEKKNCKNSGGDGSFYPSKTPLYSHQNYLSYFKVLYNQLLCYITRDWSKSFHFHTYSRFSKANRTVLFSIF